MPGNRVGRTRIALAELAGRHRLPQPLVVGAVHASAGVICPAQHAPWCSRRFAYSQAERRGGSMPYWSRNSLNRSWSPPALVSCRAARRLDPFRSGRAYCCVSRRSGIYGERAVGSSFSVVLEYAPADSADPGRTLRLRRWSPPVTQWRSVCRQCSTSPRRRSSWRVKGPDQADGVYQRQLKAAMS